MSTSAFYFPFFPTHRPSLDHHHPANASSDPHSRPSFLSPLSGLARRPAAFFEYLRDEFTPLPSAEIVARHELEDQKELCSLRLRQATTLGEWQAAAVELDELDGNDVWKQELESPEYHFDLVNAKLQELDAARASYDPQRMLFLVRTGLTRYLGRMGNVQLYKHSNIGTKNLIERYIASALDTITALLDSTRRPGSGGIDSRHLLDQIVLARQSFGRSALLLSGGGTFGMNHIGVVKCLWESKLLPRILSGASAGSIVASVLCSRTDEELPMLLEEFCYGDLAVFTGQGEDSYVQQFTRLLKQGAIFDIGNLTRVMKNLLGNMTFQEAYNRTRRILNICVSSAGLYDLPRLLNYVTAPNVIIWSAVAASCSVPLVFEPAPLLAKDARTGEAGPWNISPQSWIDGSVDNDLPMTRLAELFNVNHFIVSQVNPHVVPFLLKEADKAGSTSSSQRAAIRGTEAGWVATLSGMAKDEAMHRMHVLSELGVFPTILTKVRSILSQRYSGDITILPEISYAEVLNVLKNPTVDFIQRATLAGERATWPRLSQIQNHCAIELALDDAVQQLRARIAFSSSAVDLRSLAIHGPPSRANSDGGRRARGSARRRRLRLSKQTDFDAASSQANRPNMSRSLSKPRTNIIHNDDSDSSSSEDDDTPRLESEANGLRRSTSLIGPSKPQPPSPHRQRATRAPSLRLNSLVRPPSSPRLFPHASQPATPLHGHDLLSLSPASVAAPAVAPLSTPKPARAAGGWPRPPTPGAGAGRRASASAAAWRSGLAGLSASANGVGAG